VIEKELLSSTSTGVCEAWTGTTISRTKGWLPPGSITTVIVTEKGNILDFGRHLILPRKLDCRRAGPYWWLETNAKNKHEDFKFIVDGAPNFTLSLRKPSRWRYESTLVVVVGLAIQALAWGLVRLFVGWTRKRRGMGSSVISLVEP
jgi:hypothetical protein